MTRRSRKIKRVKPAIYIVCEGKNTEPIYFKGIIESVGRKFSDYAFEVVVFDTPKTDPVGLINEARKLLLDHEADEAWAVYDKDGYTQHAQAYQSAHNVEPNVNIAFTSIAFEHWILLHFERNKKAYHKSHNIIDKLRHHNYFRNYSKKANINLYGTLHSKTHIAIENAAWLREQMKKEAIDQKKRIYDINPYTTVDFLIKRLLQVPYDIIWHKPNKKLKLRQTEITIKSFELQDDAKCSKLEITVTNRGTKHIIINNYLKVTNSDNAAWSIDTEEKLILDPKESKTFILSFAFVQLSDILRLWLPQENIKVVLPLDN